MDVKSLVALVPIVTLAFVFLQDRFTVHGSDVLVTALDCATTKIELMAANAGDRAGVIKSAQVRVRVDGSTGDGAHRLISTGDGVSGVYTVVKPEEPVFMSMVPMTGQAVTPLPRHPEQARQCSYQLEIEVVEFQQKSNETKIIYTSCDCPH
jgi:hypothetical protein